MSPTYYDFVDFYDKTIKLNKIEVCLMIKNTNQKSIINNLLENIAEKLNSG